MGAGLWLTRGWAQRWPRQTADTLIRVARVLQQLHPKPIRVALPASPEARRLMALDGETDQALPSRPGKARDRIPHEPKGQQEKPHANEEPAAAIGVFVSRKRVVRAANAGLRPSGWPVSATDAHPAGLSLTGITGLGVGLRDGDILTRAGGTPATSDGAVVAAVTAALRRQQKAMTAEVWRGRQRFIVTVELPKLKRVPRAGRNPKAPKRSVTRRGGRS
jgi:hypothetical protein